MIKISGKLTILSLMINAISIGVFGCGCITNNIDEKIQVESLVKGEKMEVSEVQTKQEEDSVDVSVSYDENHYYNVSTKMCKGKTFIKTQAGIYVLEGEENNYKSVEEGLYSFGTATENGIYLIEYMPKGNDYSYNIIFLNADNYSIETLASDIDITNSDGVSHYVGMNIDGSELFVEGDDCCLVYSICSETEIIFKEIIERSKRHNYPHAAISYAGLEDAYLDEVDANLYGNLHVKMPDGSTNTIEEVSDIMLTPFGALARKKADFNDIFLVNYANGEAKKVYDSEKHGNYFVGYNTFDSQGLYGIQMISENEGIIISCSWEGDLKEIYKLKSDEIIYGETLEMSVDGDLLFFHDPSDNSTKCINTSGQSIVVIKK